MPILRATTRPGCEQSRLGRRSPGVMTTAPWLALLGLVACAHPPNTASAPHAPVASFDPAGLVSLDGRTLRVPLERPGNHTWMRLISFGDVHGLVVVQSTDDEEDPPDRVQVVVVDGDSLRVAFDQVLGAYGPTRLSFGRDGEITYVEDGWTACNRAGYPETVARDRVTLRFDASAKRMTVAERAVTSAQQRCGELAG